jgi:hypothetical protein
MTSPLSSICKQQLLRLNFSQIPPSEANSQKPNCSVRWHCAS